MAGKVSRAKAPDTTQKGVGYLQELARKRTPVRVRMSDNQEFEGVIEFFDLTFIRLTREGAANLFLYKQDIKYVYELA